MTVLAHCLYCGFVAYVSIFSSSLFPKPDLAMGSVFWKFGLVMVFLEFDLPWDFLEFNLGTVFLR